MFADQDVWHEVVEDRVRQCAVLGEFCEGWPGRSALVLMGQPWDAVIYDGGVGVAFAEVKWRKHEFGRYVDYTIDCAKMDRIWEEAREKGRWTCLIVSWEGEVRWARVDEGGYAVGVQKRRDRDELADRVYHVPLSLFERIPERGVSCGTMQKLKTLVLAIVLCAVASVGYAQVGVRGYYRSNGTYVQPYQRTAPDRSIYNNYSTYPNVNPYTGQTGRVHAMPKSSFTTYGRGSAFTTFGY